MRFLQQNVSSVVRPVFQTPVFFLLSDHQPHRLHLAPVLRSGGDDIQAGRVDAGMPQEVRQLRHVMVNAVEGPGEQVSQAVGKYFGGRNPCPLAQGFHLPPDVGPVQGRSRPGDKDRAGADIPLLSIAPQLLPQGRGQEDSPGLSLAGHHSFPADSRLHGDIGHLADPDAGGADGLDQQGQPFALLFLCRPHKTPVLLPAQFPLFRAVDLFLDPERPDTAVAESPEPQKPVDRRQVRIGAGGGIAFPQFPLVVQHQRLIDLPSLGVRHESPDGMQVFLYGGRALFRFQKSLPVGFYHPFL